MRHFHHLLLPVALVALFGLACEEVVTLNSDMEVSFTIKDTTGVVKTAFKQGEDFDMSLVITNLTGEDQAFFYSGPQCSFEIWQNDNQIAASTDGYAWVLVVLSDTLRSGQSKEYVWRAPTTPAQNPKVELVPGTYSGRACACYDFINDVGLTQPLDIQFSIVP